ncbi:glycerophosphodiester phosphodiesterase family protein [Flavivirga rizhaonensis]|uniref:Glycerophosphodiester phosphodiesterase n=1 Tax=Flavivirga rizhaonensis TaxID=2559571 RepID=A0A4S1DWM8_9FLAO|nr:glycerophosphodiester phosphodiesterase family protein [Flavivirga rizhaonensis]TGV02546.1 glycerophosphodiester phosphodiesterase [Flavivirga rizhaonensis]
MSCNESVVIDIQGHRGCRGLMPENTIPAFKKAIALGVHTLELDVAVSKDHIVVVSHEPYMNGSICLDHKGKEIPESDDKKYNLYQMTFDSIKQFDCGTKFYSRFPEQEKIKTYKPSLDEVIKISKLLNPNIRFNIEIKSSPEYDDVYTPGPRDFVQLVLEVIKKNNAFADTNLQSFDLRILEEIKKQAPKMEVALLVEEDKDIWNKITAMTYLPEIISPYYKLLNKKTVKNLKAENFKVIPWTVNDVEELQKMIDFEVNGIITDYPNRLIEILED